MHQEQMSGLAQQLSDCSFVPSAYFKSAFKLAKPANTIGCFKYAYKSEPQHWVQGTITYPKILKEYGKVKPTYISIIWAKILKKCLKFPLNNVCF